MRGAALTGRHPANHLRAIFERRLGVKSPGLPGHALGDDAGVGVN